MAKRELDLDQAVKLMGKRGFKKAVIDELESDAASLPLEIFTQQGGWPDDDTLQVEVVDIEQENSKTKVTVVLSFDEVVPTGCSAININEGCTGRLEIWFEKGSKPYFEFESDND